MFKVINKAVRINVLHFDSQLYLESKDGPCHVVYIWSKNAVYCTSYYLPVHFSCLRWSSWKAEGRRQRTRDM